VTPEDVTGCIHEVIRIAGTFDKTTVRDAIIMFLLSKYIKQKTDVRCIFSGDGNDEICQGYKSFYRAPNAQAAHEESMRLLKDLHMYDLQRADHTTAANGLELRAPFLDHFFSAYYLSQPMEKRKPSNVRLEKHLMRKAFNGKGVIPQEIIWKPKQDIVDGIATDFYLPKVIKDYVQNKVIDWND
jgi:asparagine synthase (glutamine-hydrolysing)